MTASISKSVALAATLLFTTAFSGHRCRQPVGDGVLGRICATRRRSTSPIPSPRKPASPSASPMSAAAGQPRSRRRRLRAIAVGYHRQHRCRQRSLPSRARHAREISADLKAKLGASILARHGQRLSDRRGKHRRRHRRLPAGRQCPTTSAEFFDATAFPGARAIANEPQPGPAPSRRCAAGQPADKLFPVDLDKAFRALEGI